MRKIVFLAVLMIAISSLTVVSAGWFDFGGNPQEISGITFNLPGDYEEVSQPDNEELVMDFDGMKDVETKYFGFNQSDGTSIKPNQIAVSVVSDSGVELEDAEKFTYGEDDQDIDFDDYEKTTIGDKSGYAFNSEGKDIGGGHMTPEYHKFFYMEGDKLVYINMYGWSPYVSADLIADIIG
jgi:hypothetical protein